MCFRVCRLSPVTVLRLLVLLVTVSFCAWVYVSWRMTRNLSNSSLYMCIWTYIYNKYIYVAEKSEIRNPKSPLKCNECDIDVTPVKNLGKLQTKKSPQLCRKRSKLPMNHGFSQLPESVCVLTVHVNKTKQGSCLPLFPRNWPELLLIALFLSFVGFWNPSLITYSWGPKRLPRTIAHLLDGRTADKENLLSAVTCFHSFRSPTIYFHVTDLWWPGHSIKGCGFLSLE